MYNLTQHRMLKKFKQMFFQSELMSGLSGTLWGSDRNITIANRLTSVPLTHTLLKEPYKLTIVGTLNANILEIPSSLPHV